MMPAAAWASTAACNVSAEQPSEGGQTQELLVISGALVGSPLAATHRVRRKEKFHALDVSGRCAVALVHVTATDPLCAGRHPDLVARAVIADRGASGVGAVAIVVARERRIVTARIADAVMDGVMPVVIVIGGSVRPSRGSEA